LIGMGEKWKKQRYREERSIKYKVFPSISRSAFQHFVINQVINICISREKFLVCYNWISRQKSVHFSLDNNKWKWREIWWQKFRLYRSLVRSFFLSFCVSGRKMWMLRVCLHWQRGRIWF
jgi:hypothetical protein